VVKWSVVIGDHKTSVSLEKPFWKALKEIAATRGVPVSKLVAEVEAARQHGNLSSTLRLFVLEFYRDQLANGSKGTQRVA